MASRRRGHAEEHENAERWLLTYADMITLLMAFFIMLYAMSQLDIKKFDAMTGSVQAQLGGTGVLKASMNAVQAPESRGGAPGISPTPGGGSGSKQQLADQLRPLVSSMGMQVTATSEGVKVSVPATTLYFASGSAQPTQAMLNALQRLATVLERGRYSVKVTGHTCSLPVHNGRYESNWELSADRARNVAFRLIRYGAVPAGRCSTMGLADSQPVAPNDTEAHRAQNRRVEITLTPLREAAPAPEHGSPRAEKAASPQAPIDIRPHLDHVGGPREESDDAPASAGR